MIQRVSIHLSHTHIRTYIMHEGCTYITHKRCTHTWHTHTRQLPPWRFRCTHGHWDPRESLDWIVRSLGSSSPISSPCRFQQKILWPREERGGGEGVLLYFHRHHRHHHHNHYHHHNHIMAVLTVNSTDVLEFSIPENISSTNRGMRPLHTSSSSSSSEIQDMTHTHTDTRHIHIHRHTPVLRVQVSHHGICLSTPY